MGKFNTMSIKTGTKAKADMVNSCGVPSYARNDFKQDVAAVVLTSMLGGDAFYESEAEKLKRIEALVASEPELAKFVAKAMVYARTEANLRSISHFLGVLLAEKAKGTDYLRSALGRTIVRPDDAVEMLALFNSRNSTMLPNSMRRAFKDAFETKFDGYQLRKYANENSAVKLKDVVKLCRPNPERLVSMGKATDSNIFKQLIEGTLPKIQTAQTVNAGSTGEARAENYKELLLARKLGYMAALKNIKNILESGADTETISALNALLVNEKAVLNSKLLPFRFYQAYREVQGLNIDRIVRNNILESIEVGFAYSARNVGLVEGDEKIAILLDESGSMSTNVDGPKGRQSISSFEIGKVLVASMFGGLKKGNAACWFWGDSSREVSLKASPLEWVFKQDTKGGGTDLVGAIKGLIQAKTAVDVIVIITDMQQNYFSGGYRGGDFLRVLNEYKSQFNPNAKVLFWNVYDYGTGNPCKMSNNVLEVTGFSDKILEVASKMLKFQDPMFLVKEIEKIQL